MPRDFTDKDPAPHTDILIFRQNLGIFSGLESPLQVGDVHIATQILDSSLHDNIRYNIILIGIESRIKGIRNIDHRIRTGCIVGNTAELCGSRGRQPFCVIIVLLLDVTIVNHFDTIQEQSAIILGNDDILDKQKRWRGVENGHARVTWSFEYTTSL